MISEKYNPGPAEGAEVQKNGDEWTLVLVRELRHSPEKVWQALTDPAQLREWAPFDADRNLGAAGTVRMTTVGMPNESVSETEVTAAEPPHVLEYNWGGNSTRWQLEGSGGGTRLTLYAKIDRRYIAMGAAGWHVCIDSMDHLLQGDPIGRVVGQAALGFHGWQRLHKEYSEQFGVEMPSWTTQ